MKKLRIAQITNLAESVPPLNKNGLEQVVFYLTEELVKMGHKVTLFATADSKTSAKLVPLWPRAVTRDFLSQLLNPGLFVSASAATALEHSQEFDIIHDHTRFVLPYYAGLASTPVVSTIHHPISHLMEYGYKTKFPEEYFPYFRLAWERFRDRVHPVAVSHFQAKNYPAPCAVIPNGLAAEEWPFSSRPGKYLAFLGYITPQKGVLEAMRAALSTNLPLLVAGPIHVGDTAARAFFRKKIQPLLNERIKYLGPLDYAEKQKFLAGARATLMPIQWDEPFGLVAIESLACGTPVIAWNRAALPEIIDDGQTGFLVNSLAEMTQKISEVDKLDRRQCRRAVEERFTAARMARDYVNLYRQILEHG